MFLPKRTLLPKCVQIRSFFWSVFSRILTEYGETQTRKNSVFGLYLRSGKPIHRVYSVAWLGQKLGKCVLFLIILSNSTISIPNGWILKLFHPWEIGLSWPKVITLIQLNRIKTFSQLNQTSAQECSLRYTNKLSKKLDDPSTIPKAYWSILNTFLNYTQYSSTKCTR